MDQALPFELGHAQRGGPQADDQVDLPPLLDTELGRWVLSKHPAGRNMLVYDLRDAALGQHGTGERGNDLAER